MYCWPQRCIAGHNDVLLATTQVRHRNAGLVRGQLELRLELREDVPGPFVVGAKDRPAAERPGRKKPAAFARNEQRFRHQNPHAVLPAGPQLYADELIAKAASLTRDLNKSDPDQR